MPPSIRSGERMKSIINLTDVPAGVPLTAEDFIEFHASRLILLISLLGDNGSITGLTKLAKLDFFVRYPDFFRRASEELSHKRKGLQTTVESAMIRHHYGPWDKRYYHVLS